MYPHINSQTGKKKKKTSIVKKILEAKLEASKEFQLALEEGKNSVFIEGTMDAFWGAGMPYHVAVHTNPKKLRGENQMGILLDTIRDDMMNKNDCISLSSNKISPRKIEDAPTPPEGTNKPPPPEATPLSPRSDTTADPPSRSTTVAPPPPSPQMDAPKTSEDLNTAAPPPENNGQPLHNFAPPSAELTMIEHDFELFPKHVMVHECTLVEKRKSRTLNKINSITRSRSCYKADRRDMRPIDDYFAAGKRKALGAAPSPDSEAVSRMIRTGSDTDAVPTPPLIMDGTDYEAGCTPD